MSLSPSILPVYRRADVTMQRGEGVYLFDTNGKRYLDFASGIAVNGLGHGHPHLVAAMRQQVETLWHCSNYYQNEQLQKFSQRLTKLAGLHSAFFCNSGAEGVEAALKFTRRYFDKTGKPERYRFIVAEGAFHGRTLATLSSCRSATATEGYAPLMEDWYSVAPFNQPEALEALITPETAAIMLEPVQGEIGIRPHSIEYLQKARQLCDKYGLLLVLDEVQCGSGRVGTFFAYEQFGIRPDIVVIGKGVGNGFPLAACLVNEAVATVMEPGCHGSTFGSNPLAMCAGNAVLDVMLEPGFFSRVQERATQLREALEAVQKKFPNLLKEVRGMGMLLGMPVTVSSYELSARLRENGLLMIPAGEGVLRVVPPLIIEETHIAEAVDILSTTLDS